MRLLIASNVLPAGRGLGLLRAEGGEEHLFVGEADRVELGHRRHDLPHVAEVEGAVRAERAEVLLLKVVQDEHGAAEVALPAAPRRETRFKTIPFFLPCVSVYG